MTSIRIGRADPTCLHRMAELGEVAQAVPETFLANFGEERAAIEAEIAGVDRWVEHTHVAFDGDTTVGWLLAEVEPELDRVWWWGPVVDPSADWDEVAESLYVAARDDLDARYSQEEFAGDVRADGLAALAARHGFAPEEPSLLLRTAVGSHPADDRVAPLSSDDAEEVATLHDAIFPGTHTTGQQLVQRTGDARFVMRDGTQLVGYVAVELEAGGDGYIDFLGVDPTRRGQGAGRALVSTALHDLARRGVTGAFLVVHTDNHAARRLYASLGFAEDRPLRPYRKGFGAGG